jgi:hypothetical protein
MLEEAVIGRRRCGADMTVKRSAPVEVPHDWARVMSDLAPRAAPRIFKEFA